MLINFKTRLFVVCLSCLCLGNLWAYSGGSGTAEDPYQIAHAQDLLELGSMVEDYDKHFVLTADIDLDPELAGNRILDQAVIASVSNMDSGGVEEFEFTGVFDGQGFTIYRLNITGGDGLGLFGKVGSGAVISHLGLEDVMIIGSHSNGGLAGVNKGDILSCFCSGILSGEETVGGLVGKNEGNITRCYSMGLVSGENNVGGLVGDNASKFRMVTDEAFDKGGIILQSHSISTVEGHMDIGGLVGDNTHVISQSYSDGFVHGNFLVGGLAGHNCGYIKNCYSSSKITAKGYAGGLVGQHGGVINPYAAADKPYMICSCYSTGEVSHEGGAGGLVGVNVGGAIKACYWDTETSGRVCSDGGTGLNTCDMQLLETYNVIDWDFDAIWTHCSSNYPRLQWQEVQCAD